MPETFAPPAPDELVDPGNSPLVDVEPWQDHWPSLSYDIEQDAETYKENEIDPEAAFELFKEMGIPESEIPELTLTVTKMRKYTVVNARGAFNPESEEAGGKPQMLLRTGLDPDQRTVTLVHEGTHFKDSLDGRLKSPAERGAYLAASLIGAVGAAAVVSYQYSKLGLAPSRDHSLVENAALAGAHTANLLNNVTTGFRLFGRFNSDERRAYAAQKNKDLTDKFARRIPAKLSS